MPSRIHAICNPVLLFHVAIHSCAPSTTTLHAILPIPPFSSPPASSTPAFYIRRHQASSDQRRPNRTDRPTNGRLWLLPLIAARCTLCPIHDSFFIAIKMQLRRFDKARITGALVPLSRLHPPTTLTRPPDIGLDRRDGWNNRWAVIRGKIATFWWDVRV